MPTKRNKPPAIQINFTKFTSAYVLTKIVHASKIPLDDGGCLRVGDKTYDEKLVDTLAERYDVSITQK